MTEDEYIQKRFRGAQFIRPKSEKVKIIPVPKVKEYKAAPPKPQYMPKNYKNLA